jgi:hypothetical protein
MSTSKWHPCSESGMRSLLHNIFTIGVSKYPYPYWKYIHTTKNLKILIYSYRKVLLDEMEVLKADGLPAKTHLNNMLMQLRYDTWLFHYLSIHWIAEIPNFHRCFYFYACITIFIFTGSVPTIRTCSPERNLDHPTGMVSIWLTTVGRCQCWTSSWKNCKQKGLEFYCFPSLPPFWTFWMTIASGRSSR